MRVHYTDAYLMNPVHKVTVDLVGLGGTGSIVLTNLARINEALTGLGHPGLHVRAWDDDLVTEFNKGRQLFSSSDLGINKAMVLVTRINRFFGYSWQAIPEKYTGTMTSNILITCVDSARARLMIGEKMKKVKKAREPVDDPYYWLDIGNLQKTGQCVLGTLQQVKQPRKTGESCRAVLPDVVKKFPQLKRINEDDQGPSCSLAEALQRQDLFINSTLAQFGCNLLWKLMREGGIRYQGCYVNMDTLSVNPMKIV